jgi:hypothetical protein
MKYWSTEYVRTFVLELLVVIAAKLRACTSIHKCIVRGPSPRSEYSSARISESMIRFLFQAEAVQYLYLWTYTNQFREPCVQDEMTRLWFAPRTFGNSIEDREEEKVERPIKGDF